MVVVQIGRKIGHDDILIAHKILYVQEVLTKFSELLYQMGQDFLDIQYIPWKLDKTLWTRGITT